MRWKRSSWKTGTRLSYIALRWRHNEWDGVSNHQPHDCLLNRLSGRRSKKTSKPRVTGLCAGNSPETGGFPAQMASNAETVSIWWRHHGQYHCCWRRDEAMNQNISRNNIENVLDKYSSLSTKGLNLSVFLPSMCTQTVIYVGPTLAQRRHDVRPRFVQPTLLCGNGILFLCICCNAPERKMSYILNLYVLNCVEKIWICIC